MKAEKTHKHTHTHAHTFSFRPKECVVGVTVCPDFGLGPKYSTPQVKKMFFVYSRLDHFTEFYSFFHLLSAACKLQEKMNSKKMQFFAFKSKLDLDMHPDLRGVICFE